MNSEILPLLVVLVQAVPTGPFPKWEAVTPQTMLKPVPHAVPTDSPGSVVRYPFHEPLSDTCRIIEGGKVVGYRLNC